jgi:hypothetical protein
MVKSSTALRFDNLFVLFTFIILVLTVPCVLQYCLFIYIQCPVPGPELAPEPVPVPVPGPPARTPWISPVTQANDYDPLYYCGFYEGPQS